MKCENAFHMILSTNSLANFTRLQYWPTDRPTQQTNNDGIKTLKNAKAE